MMRASSAGRRVAWWSFDDFILCGLREAPILSRHRVMFGPRFVRDRRPGRRDFFGRELAIMLRDLIRMTGHCLTAFPHLHHLYEAVLRAFCAVPLFSCV